MDEAGNGAPDELIAEAARIWTGFGLEPYPRRSSERLDAQFGARQGGVLALMLDDFERDYYRFGPIAWEDGIESVIAAASARFRELHPGVPEGVVEVFEWCWSWDHR